MIVHLVTDRRRISGPAITSAREVRRCLVRQARYAIEAGIDVVQIRERDLDARDLFKLVQEVVRASRGSGTQVVVSDRLDVALAAGADGVHLPRLALRPAQVRGVVPLGFIVGCSVHNLAEAGEALGADYLLAGTVWKSGSKPADHDLIGVEGLKAIVRAVQVPVLAIGGVAVSRAAEVAAAGGAGVAAIGMFFDGTAALDCAAVSLSSTVHLLRAGFDTSRSAS